MKYFNYVSGLPDLRKLETDESTGERFYVSPTGKKLPSVTTVLGHFKRKSLYEWRNRVGAEEAQKISTKASLRGTKFHTMVEKYLRNDKTLFENVMPNMIQSFRDVKNELDKIDNIHYIEGQLYSESLGIAGRTDCIGEYSNTLSIIDFKTSTKEKKEHWIENYFEQGTAYALMYEELIGMPINQIVIIISVDHLETPQVFIKDKKDYVDSLRDKIKLYKKETQYVP